MLVNLARSIWMPFVNCKNFSKLCYSENTDCTLSLCIWRANCSKNTLLCSDTGRSVILTNKIWKHNKYAKDFFLHYCLISENSETKSYDNTRKQSWAERLALCAFESCNSKEISLNRPMKLNDLHWLWGKGKVFHFPPNHLTFIGTTTKACSRKITKILAKIKR